MVGKGVSFWVEPVNCASSVPLWFSNGPCEGLYKKKNNNNSRIAISQVFSQSVLIHSQGRARAGHGVVYAVAFGVRKEPES